MAHICIIGAGYTGLVAAYRLAIAGHKVTIYEKTNEIGGLASGFKINGVSIEKAYHHLFKTDKDIIGLVEELGLSQSLKWFDSSVAIYYNKRLYPFVTPIDLLKFTPLKFINRIRAGIVVLYLQKTKSWRRFMQISAYSWMKKWAGKEVTKVIWEPLLLGKFSRFYNKVSMAWLWARIHIRANSKAKGDLKEKLGYFAGGFDIFTQALTKKLYALGVEINLNSNISEIGSDESTNIVVNDKKIHFDKILATIPSSVFAKLLKSDAPDVNKYIQKATSIDYLGAIVLTFSSKQNLSKYYWHNINDLNSPFLVFIEHTNLVSPEWYGGDNIYYIGTYVPHDHEFFNDNDLDIKEKWFNYLFNIFPEFNRDLVSQSTLFKFKNAQHIVDLDYQSKIPEYQTPIKGIFLSNFSQIFPEDRGTNYAVREGDKIAKLILKEIQDGDSDSNSQL